MASTTKPSWFGRLFSKPEKSPFELEQDAVALWRLKNDDDVLNAAAKLAEYTEPGQKAILHEVDRRGLRQPTEAVRQPTPLAGSGTDSRATRKAASEHYVLKCTECGFEHHIPGNHSEPTVRFLVEPSDVKLTCLYGGGAFTVSLKVQDFFRIEPAPASGRTLHASIGDNVKALHGHMLSHCDPLFLQVRQTTNSTHHTYTREQPGAPFVRFSSDGGIDIVGSIDVAKAEIPGVS